MTRRLSAEERNAMKVHEEALDELIVMLDALRREAWQLFGLGKYVAKKKLANGDMVRFSFTEARPKPTPKRPAARGRCR